MQVKSPGVIPRFHAKYLVSRRSFVFARAGFGKSNLVKLLFANLYNETPTVEKRKGKMVPVGTLIFDPDGEYFWPDDKNRPGLCDVTWLEDKVVVFTRRSAPSPFYQSFVAGNIKLDIRRLRPSDVISIALSPEKQDQQNVRKLKGLNDSDWRELVDEIYANKNAADENLIKRVLRLTDMQEAEMVAARANMTQVVNMLHDPSSQMMDMLLAALKAGKLCIVDVSQMRGTPALVLSGLILQKIFDHNQDQFTKTEPETIPTIAVVEEAQSVLGSSGSSGEGPYVSWVKEGRKYDLGAVLITQQPGSISHEILSQGDNWFVFHLLSAGDLVSVKKANAHFSDDLLSGLLNEPIPGHGVFWSSAGGKSYPIPIRVMSFENMVKPRDPEYRVPAAKTFAEQLRTRFRAAVSASRSAVTEDGGVVAPGRLEPTPDLVTMADGDGGDDPEDVFETHVQAAICKVKQNQALLKRIREGGETWVNVRKALASALPDVIENREDEAHKLVPRFLDETLGEGKWDKERRPSKSRPGETTAWIVLK